MIERSLVLIKPDAVKRGIVGEIIHRFERAGLKIIALKLIQADREKGSKHYPNTEEWLTTVGKRTIEDCEKYGIDLMTSMGTTEALEIGKKVKEWNIDYLTAGPVVAFVFEGLNAVERLRTLVGHTVPTKASPGTIRGDFALDSAISANREGRSISNLIHASGSVEEAIEEINLWFKPEEIL